MKRRLRCITMLSIAALAASAAHAQEDRMSSPIEDYFRITAGAFAATTETGIRLDATAGTPGTSLSGEDDLGLRDRSTIVETEAQVRIRKRHHVKFGYSALNRRSSVLLERQIRFGDDVYNVNDVVQSRFDISDVFASYSYSFVRRERFELAASLNLHLLEYEAGARVAARSIDEESIETGPLLTPGLQAVVRFNRRLHAEASAEYLSAIVDDIDGRVRNLRGAIFYRFNRNISLGLGYTSNEIEVISRDAGDSGRFFYGNSGGELMLRAAF